jgi:hypothetical protein
MLLGTDDIFFIASVNDGCVGDDVTGADLGVSKGSSSCPTLEMLLGTDDIFIASVNDGCWGDDITDADVGVSKGSSSLPFIAFT